MPTKPIKVLITGSNGFIGGQIARYLKACGYAVTGLDTGSSDTSGVVSRYIQMILPNTDIEGVMNTLKPDYCVHCAGLATVGSSITNPGIDFNSGPPVVFNILDAIRKTRLKCRLIFLSSAAVYGNPKKLPIKEDANTAPISPYGFHKAICENIIAEFEKD